jgi:hypothetical protein
MPGSSSLLPVGGQLPLVNGQASSVMVTSPALGPVGQTQVALNLTDSTEKHGVASMGVNPADANLSSVQNSTRCLGTSPDFLRAGPRR